MTLTISIHLNFRGEARAALSFYHAVFGGQLAAVTYRDAHAVTNEAEADQIIWGKVENDSGFRIMAYDVPSRLEWNPGTIPFFVSLRGSTADEITALWDGLAAGATIVAPIGPSAWSPLYGMLKDRFGITWVLDIAPAA